ncbi:N-acetyl-gamma-glutamyl-phosphate reductase [Aggregicoccus sp. 17bor-14]|uniref:N-acetyl-gamma-glutamyl-phosphate reductase n=1 Tax=Myxococcaceae TaxID=31 RepID=UPI00129CCF68|nr:MULTISPECIES: N-acetyl-gamma-glutamyl-phosphate reductase [Myxococcaceae]MBF5043252.1 N-acetyl-gamma-glutamyl-phosphate reductase [Simulacricoccus sp. 17bor-14]MRI89009.1 N-acetyl-gamma-glutamyl-phosphate reductase [Aggregicoccus sp. 17bor-14]
MHKASVGIVGASGYAGMEATRLLAHHPYVDVRFVTSERWAGESVEARLGACGPVGRLTYGKNEDAVQLARGCDVVLLATPAEVSLALAPQLLSAGIRVIDLSGAFRLAHAGTYPRHYGFTHTAPELLGTAAYGMPELFRDSVPQARLVANPGCYPTAATLALAPLLAGGSNGNLIRAESLIVTAASGVTGAGRKASEDYSFTEVEGDFRAYKVLKHQHTPEIAQALGRCAGVPVGLTFTAQLLPVKRGILSTAVVSLRPGVGSGDFARAYQQAYAGEQFVQLLPSADHVNLKSVVGTNRCTIGFACDPDTGRAIVVSALDNLVKGAAGQAVQNLNLMLGLEETWGLTSLRAYHP